MFNMLSRCWSVCTKSSQLEKQDNVLSNEMISISLLTIVWPRLSTGTTNIHELLRTLDSQKHCQVWRLSSQAQILWNLRWDIGNKKHPDAYFGITEVLLRRYLLSYKALKVVEIISKFSWQFLTFIFPRKKLESVIRISIFGKKKLKIESQI